MQLYQTIFIFCVSILIQEPPKQLNLTHTTSFVVFPADTNANPPMAFGGSLLAHMDRCAAITTRRFLYDSTVGAKDYVTVGLDKGIFHKGAKVKDLIYVTGTVIKAKSKIVVVKVIVEKEISKDVRELLLEAEFTFCSVEITKDDQGNDKVKAIEHKLSVDNTMK